MSKILIPGGAGYIGSHMVKCAQEHGHEVVVLDDFSTGHPWAISNCELLEVNLLDVERLKKILKGRYFDGVINFAAKSIVSESIYNPLKYYENNVMGSINLINTMLENNITNIVFSSTAAIYGNPLTNKITEDHIKNPINPYGKSKLMVENILEDLCSTKELNSVCLRYFNAAGAHNSGQIGECHQPETHLIPNVIESAFANTNLKVYGDNYNTHDGTCVRDYVHVMDLAEAHLMALKYLENNKGFSAYNLGNSQGFSVLDIIKSCEDLTDINISYEINQRRSGDPDILIADNKLALKNLAWRPRYTEINDIIRSALHWHKNKKLVTKT